jgi:hypothetical protein
MVKFGQSSAAVQFPRAAPTLAHLWSTCRGQLPQDLPATVLGVVQVGFSAGATFAIDEMRPTESDQRSVPFSGLQRRRPYLRSTVRVVEEGLHIAALNSLEAEDAQHWACMQVLGILGFPRSPAFMSPTPDPPWLRPERNPALTFIIPLEAERRAFTASAAHLIAPLMYSGNIDVVLRAGDGKLGRGDYRVVFAGHIQPNSAVVCCPNCGRLGEIGWSSIRRDGVVLHRFACGRRLAPRMEWPTLSPRPLMKMPRLPCDFSGFVRLDGWSG